MHYGRSYIFRRMVEKTLGYSSDSSFRVKGSGDRASAVPFFGFILRSGGLALLRARRSQSTLVFYPRQIQLLSLLIPKQTRQKEENKH